MRTDLNLSVRPWALSSGGSGAIWVQISQPGGGLQFFVGVCYLPPAGSGQLRVRCVERRLESLAKEAIAADASGYVFLGGDFNAKVGSLSSPSLQDGSLPDRGSTCAAVDDHGRKLVGFCEQTGLVLCTGRAPGDQAALPTWHKRGAPSRLDHVLVSRRAFSSIRSCIVPQGSASREDSDHEPLIVDITMLADQVPPPAALAGTPLTRIAWDSCLQPKYAEALAQSPSASQLSASKCASRCGDIARADQLLKDAMTSAAIASGARRKGRFCRTGRSVTIRQDAPWFDAACKAAHRAYWRARRRAAAAVEFRDAERHYKQLVRSRQRQWQQRQLDRNLADSQRNPRALYLRLGDHPAPLPAVLQNHVAWESFLHGLASYRPPSNCELKTAPCLPSFDPNAAAELNIETITTAEVLAAMR